MTEEQIWDILDGNALPEVQEKHKFLMQTDAKYRVHFDSYATLHDQLCGLELEMPSMRFEQNLMERLQPTVKKQPVVDRLPLFFLVFMSTLVAIIFALIPKAEVPVSEPTSSLPVLDTVSTEGVVAWLSNPALFYGFILLNIILFFLVLDKKVFQPYFQKKVKN
ncbi:MAG: hypothetical protein JNL70_20925 [Saprospiraceae bacterium]|nr:hypothetical protein [Saprospiraceae bacterium]